MKTPATAVITSSYAAHRCRCTLVPKASEVASIEATLAAYSRACIHAFHAGQDAGTTGNARIHALCYSALRERFGLSANLAVRAISRAAKHLKERPAAPDATRLFPPTHIDYDARILRLADDARTVSLSTIHGRLPAVRLVAPDNRRALMQGRQPRRAWLTKEPASNGTPAIYLLTLLIASREDA